MPSKAEWHTWLLRLGERMQKRCHLEEGGNGCLIWQGAQKKSKGRTGPAYGVMNVKLPGANKRCHVTVHRLAYLVANQQGHREILGVTEFEISHICHNSLCVNPEHLSREPHACNNSRLRCKHFGQCHGHGKYADCIL